MHPEDIEALYELGLEALENEEWDEAISLANALLDSRYTGGFEIKALAQAGSGHSADAVATLRAALEAAPDVWLFHNLLGNCLSDEGNYEDALAAYERGATCPGADLEALRYNRLLVLQRREDYQRALDELEAGHWADFKWECASLRVALLIEQNRHREAEAAARLALEEVRRDEQREAEEVEVVAELYAGLGTALYNTGGASQEALDAAWSAVGLDPRNEDAQWLIREIENRTSPDTRRFRLIIEGHEPLSADEPSFMVTYTVAAATEDEALALANRFESPRVRESLELVECLIGEPVDVPHGVYSVSRRVYFELEDEEGDEDDPEA